MGRTHNKSMERALASMEPNICTNCGQPNASSFCPCKEAWYCGRECQKTHWKKGHKKCCKGKPKSAKSAVDPKWTQFLTKLTSKDPAARESGLKKLGDSPLLCRFGSLVVNRLADTEPDVRQQALLTLSNLPPKELDMFAVAVLSKLADGYKNVRDAAVVCLKKLGTGGLLSKYAKDMVDHLAAGSKAVEKDMSAMMSPGCRGDPRLSALAMLRTVAKKDMDALAQVEDNLVALAAVGDQTAVFMANELLALLRKSRGEPKLPANNSAPAPAPAEEEEGVRGSSTHVDLNNLKDSGTGELSAEEFAALRAKTKSAAECAKNMTPEQQAAYGCKAGVAASAVRVDSDESDDEGADFQMGAEGQGALLADY